MKKLLLPFLALIASVSAFAGEAGSYPNATALGGTERIVADQTGVTKNITPAQMATYVGNNLPAGSVTLADQANLPAFTFQGNNTASSAAPVAFNPLAATNMMNVGMVAGHVSAAGNITLSGLQTIDGIALQAGETILVAAQTTQSQNGIYIVSSGAWTRAPFFPAGYVLPAFCDITVFIPRGTAGQGFTYWLANSSAVTVGTTAQNWVNRSIQQGSATVLGLVRVTTTGNTTVASMVGAPTGIGGAVNDCVSFASVSGDIGDQGDSIGTTGPCVTSDPITGHPNMSDFNTPPTVSTGTLAAASSDEHGQITGLTAATTVTLTFSGKWVVPQSGGTARAAHCTANDSAASIVGVTPNANGLSVVFTMTALTGSLSYLCF